MYECAKTLQKHCKNIVHIYRSSPYRRSSRQNQNQNQNQTQNQTRSALDIGEYENDNNDNNNDNNNSNNNNNNMNNMTNKSIDIMKANTDGSVSDFASLGIYIYIYM